jgi:hypothetical protein
MLVRVKSLVIILLIMSLSVVPSVNASSDIFNEPVHLSYNDLKERMVEYIETPDYLKASMPPIISSNEYIDFEDYIQAAEDLFKIPVIDNSTLEKISSSSDSIPIFKNLNTKFVELIKRIDHAIKTDVYMNAQDARFNSIYDPDFGEAHYDGPGEFNNVVNELHLYVQYKFAANNLKNIITDSIYFFDMPNMDNFFNPNKILIIDNVQFTARELFDRISTSRVSLDGRYQFTNTAPLASGSALKSVNVDSVIRVFNDNYIILNNGAGVIYTVNCGLSSNNMPVMPDLQDQPHVDFRTDNNNVPKRFVEKDLPCTKIVIKYTLKDEIYSVSSLTMDGSGSYLDIRPDLVTEATSALNLKFNDEGRVVTETISTNRPEYYTGLLESGLMFVFAIITLILAFIYR